MPGKFYRFAYFGHSVKEHENWRPHHLRDAEAFLFLADQLAARGYRSGGPILNHPPTARTIAALGGSRSTPPSGRIEIREPAWSRDDVVVLTTRPPLTDWDYQTRRTIHRSWTTLEQRVFDTFRPLFRDCSRRRVALSEELEAALDPADRLRAWAGFRIQAKRGHPHLRAAYYTVGRKGESVAAEDPEWGWSPVYLVSIDVNPDAWNPGPGKVLALWGIGELETLVFAKRLSDDPELRSLLDGPQFFMGELKLEPLDPEVQDFSFADRWMMRPLLRLDPTPCL